MLQKFPAEAAVSQGEMNVTAGIVEFADLNNGGQERPHFVMLKKTCLRPRGGRHTARGETWRGYAFVSGDFHAPTHRQFTWHT